MNWKPIEDAPYDTEVLVYYDKIYGPRFDLAVRRFDWSEPDGYWTTNAECRVDDPDYFALLEGPGLETKE